MAHPKLEEVRRRFRGCCGYCGVSETDSGGALTVDHFDPQSAGGDDSEQNLIYACFRCNTYKGEWRPTEEDVRVGRRLLHPFIDRVTDHLREADASGRLEALTTTGAFHITLLRLNRPELIEYRLQRRLRQLFDDALALLQDENGLLKLRLANLERYVQELKRQSEKE
jgi:hypothetical protein